jgi:cell division protein FtsB
MFRRKPANQPTSGSRLSSNTLHTNGRSGLASDIRRTQGISPRGSQASPTPASSGREKQCQKDLRKAREDLKHANDEIKAQNVLVDSRERDIVGLQATIGDLHQRTRDLEKELAECKKHRGQDSTGHKRSREDDDELEKVQADRRQLRREKAQLNAKNETLTAENINLEEELADLKKKYGKADGKKE